MTGLIGHSSLLQDGLHSEQDGNSISGHIMGTDASAVSNALSHLRLTWGGTGLQAWLRGAQSVPGLGGAAAYSGETAHSAQASNANAAVSESRTNRLQPGQGSAGEHASLHTCPGTLPRTALTPWYLWLLGCRVCWGSCGPDTWRFGRRWRSSRPP